MVILGPVCSRIGKILKKTRKKYQNCHLLTRDLPHANLPRCSLRWQMSKQFDSFLQPLNRVRFVIGLLQAIQQIKHPYAFITARENQDNKQQSFSEYILTYHNGCRSWTIWLRADNSYFHRTASKWWVPGMDSSTRGSFSFLQLLVSVSYDPINSF